jgi:hypothetical protein
MILKTILIKIMVGEALKQSTIISFNLINQAKIYPKTKLMINIKIRLKVRLNLKQVYKTIKKFRLKSLLTFI